MEATFPSLWMFIVTVITSVVSGVVTSMIVVNLANRRRNREAWRVAAMHEHESRHEKERLSKLNDSLVKMKAAIEILTERSREPGSHLSIEEIENLSNTVDRCEKMIEEERTDSARRTIDSWNRWDMEETIREIVRLGLFDSTRWPRKFKDFFKNLWKRKS